MANKQVHFTNKEILRQKEIDAGLVSDRFPKVSGIEINMTYHHKSNDQLLMIRTINFSSTSYALFDLKCLTKGCDNGGFELTKVITGMVKNRKKSIKGKLVCSGKNSPSSSEHAKISYEIGIKYNKKSK